MFLDKIKLISKVGFVFSFLSLVNSSPLDFVAQKFEKKTNEEAINYAKNNLEKIMVEQEQAVKIKHFGKPKVEFGDCDSDFPSGRGLVAYYDEKSETVCYPIEQNSSVELTGEKNFRQKFFENFCPDFTSNVKETMWHELGHFYSHKLAQRRSQKAVENFKLIHSKNENEFLGYKTVSEGIAEYFLKKTSGKKEDYFVDELWPENIEGMNNLLMYFGGYHLVKEVLDFYGDDGIIYLLENPPKIKNPRFDFPRYKERTMRILECLRNQKDNRFCFSLSCPNFELNAGQFDLYSHQPQSIDGLGGNS